MSRLLQTVPRADCYHRGWHIRVAAAFLLILTLCLCLPTNAFALKDPAVQAESAILVDPESGFVLYEKDADKRRFPASTTKIMTALVVLENVKDLKQTVTVTEEDFEGVSWDSSKAGFKVGETIPVIDLLYGLMLPSGNEAANTLARFVGGSVEGFADMMNQRAQTLGCSGTHFSNPNGLHDDNHYTTARDLYTITAEAMKNETFALISETAQKTLSETNMTAERGGKALKVFTTNMLIYSRSDPLYYSYATGVKTGHTSQAGYCLVAAAKKKDSRLISVMLGCEKPQGAKQPLTFSETKRLFEWGFDAYKTMKLVEKGENVAQVSVRLSTDTDTLSLCTAEDVYGTVPNDIDLADVERVVDVPETVDAPVEAGQKLGTMRISYNGVDYGQVDLVALTGASLSKVLYYTDRIERFFKGNAFKLTVLGIVAVLAVYFMLLVYRGRRRRKKRDQMMRSKYRHRDR